MESENQVTIDFFSSNYFIKLFDKAHKTSVKTADCCLVLLKFGLQIIMECKGKYLLSNVACTTIPKQLQLCVCFLYVGDMTYW